MLSFTEKNSGIFPHFQVFRRLKWTQFFDVQNDNNVIIIRSLRAKKESSKAIYKKMFYTRHKNNLPVIIIQNFLQNDCPRCYSKNKLSSQK